jgi:undecaprenyl diphosphate synthase
MSKNLGQIGEPGTLPPERRKAEEPKIVPLQKKALVPSHVAVIMDGNGRWAEGRGLPRDEGHTHGADAARETVRACHEYGVRYLTLYAFSLGNWARPRAEVDALMRLFTHFAETERENLRRRGIAVKVVGDLDDLPTPTRRAVEDLVEYTADGTSMILSVALSYGGRRDIVDAARALAIRARAGLVLPEEIDEEFFHREMTTGGLPDVDLLIRTGGDSRLSDFLLFESAYAELRVLPIMWPDMTPEILAEAIRAYGQTERRFGRTSDDHRSSESRIAAARD